jgi:hypothetical protein
VRDPAPLVTRWHSRTVANGDSITFDVRRCFQCSAGKSKNVSSTSASFSRVVTAFGVLRAVLGGEPLRHLSGLRTGLGVHHLVERRLHAGLKTLWQLVEDVAELVEPVPLFAGLRPYVPHRRPEAEGTVAYSDDGRAQAPPLQVAEPGLPALGALPRAAIVDAHDHIPGDLRPSVVLLEKR